MSTFANKIDLSAYTQRIYDQQTQGSCKANQIVAAVEMQAKMYGVTYSLSRQQLYNDTREAQGSVFETDTGSVGASAEWAATQKGIANESSFTYGTHNFSVHTPANVDAEAATQKVTSFTQISIYQSTGFMAESIAEQLMHGKPVLLDLYIHQGFGTPAYNRFAPLAGGHAVMIVGIDFEAQTYKIQNSWGTGWGDNGYGVLKFDDLPGFGGGPYGTWWSTDILGLSVVNGFDGVDLTWTSQREQVATLYTSILERCSETSGLMFWSNALKDNVVSANDIASMLITSDEGQIKYGSMSNASFVGEMYYNATGRIIDQNAHTFFTQALDNGYGRGDLAFYLINTVDTGQDTQAANDRLENMETVSMNFGLTFQADGSFNDAGAIALQSITDDANTVVIALVGLQGIIH